MRSCHTTIYLYRILIMMRVRVFAFMVIVVLLNCFTLQQTHASPNSELRPDMCPDPRGGAGSQISCQFLADNPRYACCGEYSSKISQSEKTPSTSTSNGFIRLPDGSIGWGHINTSSKSLPPPHTHPQQDTTTTRNVDKEDNVAQEINNSASPLQTSNNPRCEVTLPEQTTLLSPYEGECRNGLAHGHGKVRIKRELKTGAFDILIEGVFQHGMLTGFGKERSISDQFWYEGTFNKWQRWNGILRTGSGYKGREEQWNYNNGHDSRAPIGSTVNITQDPLYYAGTSDGNKEGVTNSDQQASNEQPQKEKTGYRSKERTGIFAVPILGPILSAAIDGTPAAGDRIGEALKNVPKDTLNRKTDEWIARQEREQQEKEEHKKQEEVARQEQARASVLAKQEQANIEALKKEQENRETKARSAVNAKSVSGAPVNPLPGPNTQSPQASPKLPENTQSKGSSSPSPSVATTPPIQNSPVVQQGAIAINHQPVINTQQQQSASLTYQNILTPQEIEWNNSLPHMYKATTQFSPAQIEEIKRDGRWGPWVAQTKKEVAQLAASTQQTNKPATPTGLTQDDLRWANTLHPSVKAQVQAIPPSQVDKLRASGKWNQVKQNLNDVSIELTNNQYQAELAAEEVRIWSSAWDKFQTTIEMGSLALGVGDLAIASRSIYAAGRAALERQAAKNVGTATARGIDSASTGVINKATTGSGVWALGWSERGKIIEQALGQNLPNNFPVIDRFENGVATSIKSIDFNAGTYQNSANLTRTLTEYIDKVANFNGAKWSNVRISGSDITSRALDLAVPNSGSTAQRDVINKIIQYGSSRGVSLNIIIFP